MATLSLPLLVTGIAADDEHDAATAHNLALVADSLDAGFDFHRCTSPRRSAGSGTGTGMAVNA
jgi:hypothetical protein